MIWRWLYVTEDMGVVEGIPCSICERPVHDRIWFPSDFEDATDISTPTKPLALRPQS